MGHNRMIVRRARQEDLIELQAVKKVLLLSAIPGAALFAVLIWLSVSGRLWWRSNKFVFTTDGKPGSALYVGPEAWLVIPKSDSLDAYVVYPKRQLLGVAVTGRFVYLPSCLLSLDKPATYIPMPKMEVPVSVSFAEHQVIFEGASGERVSIAPRTASSTR